MLRAYWWSHVRNFGDALSPRVVESLAGRSVAFCDDFTRCRIVAIGSLLHLIDARFAGEVWGTGAIDDSKPIKLPHARFAAVRGHLTRKLLGLGDDVATGDPGLFCDRFAKPATRRYRLGLIPHTVDRDDPRVATVAATSPEIVVIDICGGVEHVLEQIAACEGILASCLHGLIAADALGIPNEWVELSDKVLGGGFKFRDYYSNFGQPDKRPTLLDERDTLETLLPRLEGYRRDGLADVRQRLADAFPGRLKRKWWWIPSWR